MSVLKNTIHVDFIIYCLLNVSGKNRECERNSKSKGGREGLANSQFMWMKSIKFISSYVVLPVS